jgi:uncharacterized protein YukE
MRGVSQQDIAIPLFLFNAVEDTEIVNLRMDTQSVWEIKTELHKEAEELKLRIIMLESKVNDSIRQAWAAPAAHRFLDDFRDWRNQMMEHLDGLERLENQLSAEIAEWESTASIFVTPPPANFDKSLAIRNWWHNILGSQERYSSYSIFLVLPSDKEVIRYMDEFSKELDLISGNDSLVIVIGNTDVKVASPQLDKRDWKLAIDEHIAKGYSLKIADMFDISMTEFPCLILFQDIRSPEHVKVLLNDMSAEEIAVKMRAIFSVIHEAVKDHQNPLNALESQRNSDAFWDKGKSIVSSLRNIAEKTFEVAMEAWIKSVIK